MNKNSFTSPPPWTRRNGWLAGVCEGLAWRFNLPPNFIRLIWLISVLFLGFGLLLYIAMAFTLPHSDDPYEKSHEQLLGVCYRLHRRTGFDLGLVRLLTLLITFSSFGAGLVIYLILWLALPEPRETTY